jgi:sulfate permease, SulP family
MSLNLAWGNVGVALNKPMSRSLISSVIVGVLSVLFCLSYAALIFSGPLAPWLAYGISASFITSAVGGAMIAWRSSIPFAIGGPDGPTCAVIAALLGSLGAEFAAAGRPIDEHFLTAVLVALVLTSVLTGLLLCTLGITHAGRAIRFVPFPVIGGFFGASGVLMLTGAVSIVTGHRVSASGLDDLLQPESLAKLAAGLAVVAFLLGVRRIWPSWVAMPLQLVACIALFYVVLLALGIPLSHAEAGGWMFSVPSGVAFNPPWTLDFTEFPWASLPRLAAGFFAVMFMGTVSVLLNITGIELSTKRDAELDRELTVLGTANLVSAGLGGYVASITSARSNMNFALAGPKRLASAIVAAIMAVSLLVNPDFLAYMPKCVLGGLLLTVAWDSLKRWLVNSRRQLAPLEYASLLAITVIIVGWGYIAGVSIGVIFGCATFALSIGRVNAIKFSFDGSEYRSSLDRSQRELGLLADHGRELQGLSLQSYLFFGSANWLYEHVKALLASTPDCRFLLFDFRLVTGIDSSATHSFTQIKRAADALSTQLVLVNLTPALAAAFANIGLTARDVIAIPDLDRALEHCENEIIQRHSGADDEARSLVDWLVEALGDRALAENLAAQCRRLDFKAGEVLAQQGDPADSMHFVVEGRVGIIVGLEGGRSVRVRSLGRHTTIGEMGLITGRPRSATVQAEIDTVAYELGAGTFHSLKTDHPALAQALLTYVIGVMAERLSYASRVIGVLQR